MPLRVLIADDEFPAREELKHIFNEIGNIEVVGEFEDGGDVIEFVGRHRVNIVFLDIKMHHVDGIAAAERIRRLNQPPKIVFTTGFSEFAVKAFEINAADYVLKPYFRERLELTFEKLTRPDGDRPDRRSGNRAELPPTQLKIPVWANDRMLILNSSEIFFAKAEHKRKTLLCTEKGDYVSTMTLKEVQDRLEANGFLRTHKSYIVNLNRVREIIPWFNDTYLLSLEGCPVREIPVAKHFIAGFRSAMGI